MTVGKEEERKGEKEEAHLDFLFDLTSPQTVPGAFISFLAYSALPLPAVPTPPFGVGTAGACPPAPFAPWSWWLKRLSSSLKPQVQQERQQRGLQVPQHESPLPDEGEGEKWGRTRRVSGSEERERGMGERDGQKGKME